MDESWLRPVDPLFQPSWAKCASVLKGNRRIDANWGTPHFYLSSPHMCLILNPSWSTFYVEVVLHDPIELLWSGQKIFYFCEKGKKIATAVKVLTLEWPCRTEFVTRPFKTTILRSGETESYKSLDTWTLKFWNPKNAEILVFWIAGLLGPYNLNWKSSSYK